MRRPIAFTLLSITLLAPAVFGIASRGDAIYSLLACVSLPLVAFSGRDLVLAARKHHAVRSRQQRAPAPLRGTGGGYHARRRNDLVGHDARKHG